MPASTRAAQRTLLALVCLGAGLRAWQYAANTSFWLDELSLVENLLHHDLRALVSQPLAFDDVAPPGFLALEKGVAALLGPSERALRALPLLCGLAALGLFARLSQRFQTPWVTAFATGLFAIHPTLIAYSAQYKPYEIDVLSAVALSLAALRLRDPDVAARRFVATAGLGGAAVWISQGAVFVVAGVGAALAGLAWWERRAARGAALAGVLAVWAASALGAVASGFHRVPPEMRAYLDRFWHPGLPRAEIACLVGAGALLLAWRSRPAALILVAPALVALAAAGAHLYPFSGRLILFLAPAAVLAAAEGAARLVALLVRLGVPRALALAPPPLALVALLALRPPVYHLEETRPVLAELAKRRQPGDAIYVYYGAERAYRFYGPQLGLRASEAAIGACHRGDPRAYLRELDRLRGQRRVWVFRAHVCSALAEGPLLDGYLARLGREGEAIRSQDSEAVLWDLSARAAPPDAAETQPLPAWDPHALDHHFCGHGPLAPTPPAWQ